MYLLSEETEAADDSRFLSLATAYLEEADYLYNEKNEHKDSVKEYRNKEQPAC